MRNVKYIMTPLVLLLFMVIASGCWNYREINKLGIVAGVAVDKGAVRQYKVTVEIVKISEDKEAKPIPEIISMEGDTMFDAVRNVISIAGKRLYWPHSKAIIISQEMARKGIIKILDWYNRDSETRADINIFISRENTAERILEGNGITQVIKSYELSDMLDNERSLSKAPHTEIWEVIDKLQSKIVDPVIPVVEIENNHGKEAPHISGAAIFKHDKLIGFIDEEEVRDFLFISNGVKAGVLPEQESGKAGECSVSLEIFKNRTRIKPVSDRGNIEMDVSTYTDVAIDEIQGPENFIEDEGRKKLEADAEKRLKAEIEKFIYKIQSEYEADIFGFGAKLREDKPDLWHKVENDWDEKFKDLKVKVYTAIHIRNSAMMSKPIEAGD